MLDQSRCTSQSEQRVTTLEVLHHAREARASYGAAELHNPICVHAYMVNGPKKNSGPDYTANFQLRCRQAVHSRVAKFRTAAVGNYKSISHFNRNCNCCTSRASTALFSSAHSRLTSQISLWCAIYVGLVYPQPHFGLLSRGEAVRDEPAQYISMRAPVVPNGSHYRDSQ